MDVSAILEGLNREQRAAVSSEAQNILVLAGAGSGKTRVLTHRIAWLCSVKQVPVSSIVAVTFTNKAAAEIRGRVGELLQTPIGGMWLGTFHGLCHRLLRRHWQEAGLPQDFQILDSQDQLRLVKRTIKNLNLDESRWPPKQSQYFINRHKEAGRRPHHVETTGNPIEVKALEIYTTYMQMCERSGLVDFVELLLRAVELIRDNESLCAHYRERFQAILIDEFQDTDTLQYAWLRNLVGENTQVFVVGDDDQSIYGWRGACVENLHQFQENFTDAKVFRLECNYRSTKTILSVANELIQHNKDRLGKRLWTEGVEGDAVQLFAAIDEREEAQFVIKSIQDKLEQDYKCNNIAILYRSNAQSRVFENTLLANGIPYKVYGGLRFFERAVIKNALAYLRLAQNPADDTSFDRIINVPPRGLGATTIEIIRTSARERQIPLAQAGRMLLSEGGLPSRATHALKEFYELMDALISDKDLSLAIQARQVIELSGLQAYCQQSKDEKSKSALENLNEFVVAAAEFEDNLDEIDIATVPDDEDDAEVMTPLNRFLTYTAIEAGERQDPTVQDCVQLMTLHSAKGLEFPSSVYGWNGRRFVSSC